MRAIEGAAGGGVATTVVAEHIAVALLDIGGRMLRHQLLHPAVERDLRGRKRRALAAHQNGFEAAHGFDALAHHRNRKLRGFVLDGVEPVRIGARVFQEPVARAQRPLQRVDAAAVLGVDGERQAVEEPPALRRRASEQRVERGCQPHHTQMIGKSRRGAGRLPINPAFAHRRCGIFLFRRPLDAGAERGQPQRALDLGRNRPRAIAFGERHFVKRGAAQATAGCEE